MNIFNVSKKDVISINLQPASKEELKRISAGTVVCDGILIAVLFVLSQFGIGTFELSRVLLGTAIGSALAIANFAALCCTIQSAVAIEDQKRRKTAFQVSYHVRMLFQSAWVIIAFLLPQIHVVAGAVPLFFPNLTILYLQATGKLSPGRADGLSDP